VPFCEAEGRFADEQLRAGIRAQGLSKVDLLFIDSPVGTVGRQQLLSQFMSILSIRYVLYHDALRDAVNIFLDQQKFRLRPVTFMSSVRGLMLLENQAIEEYSSHLDTDAVINPMNVRISVDRSEPLVVAPSRDVSVRTELENLGANRISSRLHYPVVASYHCQVRASLAVVTRQMGGNQIDRFPDRGIEHFSGNRICRRAVEIVIQRS
jgi:hypothetical protein